MNSQPISVKYTHLLDVRLIDSNGNLLDNLVLLNLVKHQLLKTTLVQRINVRGKMQDCELSWKKMSWPHPYSNFLPDICLVSDYDFDYIILEHTKYTMSDIETEIKKTSVQYGNKWSIVFHISKPLSNKTDSVGFI